MPFTEQSKAAAALHLDTERKRKIPSLAGPIAPLLMAAERTSSPQPAWNTQAKHA